MQYPKQAHQVPNVWQQGFSGNQVPSFREASLQAQTPVGWDHATWSLDQSYGPRYSHVQNPTQQGVEGTLAQFGYGSMQGFGSVRQTGVSAGDLLSLEAFDTGKENRESARIRATSPVSQPG